MQTNRHSRGIVHRDPFLHCREVDDITHEMENMAVDLGEYDAFGVAAISVPSTHGCARWLTALVGSGGA